MTMTARDVLEALSALEGAGIEHRLDGGWGVDALLRRQTREHGDVDVVVDRSDAARAEEALALVGFRHAADVEPGLPARLVLRDAHRRQIDLHLVVFDEAGNGWQELSDGAWGLYPARELDGSGTVAGSPVRCITPDLQLRHHLGYPWGEADVHDLSLLAERFGVPLPPR